MLTLFMRNEPVRDYDGARAADTERYGALFRHLLERGIYVAPSQFEAMFLSARPLRRGRRPYGRGR